MCAVKAAQTVADWDCTVPAAAALCLQPLHTQAECDDTCGIAAAEVEIGVYAKVVAALHQPLFWGLACTDRERSHAASALAVPPLAQLSVTATCCLYGIAIFTASSFVNSTACCNGCKPVDSKTS
jgi:hypothetical protein